MKDIRQRLLATFQVEHRDHVEQIRALLAVVEKAGGKPQGNELDEVFRRAHSLKGAARAVDLHAVEGLAHRLETLFSRVRQGSLQLDREVSGVVHQALNASEDCVAATGEIPDFKSALSALERILGAEPSVIPAAEVPFHPEHAPVPSFQQLDTIRINSRNFDGLLRCAGELITESQRQAQVTARLRGIIALNPGRDSDGAVLERRTIARSVAAVHRLQQRSSWNLSRLSKQLQQDVWQARMVPAEGLLEGYRKMLRDLARDTSKQIEFRTTRTGVHADRGVLEAIKDPLMHMLRNAVSHGIETPAERSAKGKPPTGLITLSIGSEAQRLTVVVEDDGKGIDLARVAEVAVEQGIVAAADPTSLSPGDLARILFRPGFSTSPDVTDLSGRGMGLSVAYEAVRRLRGEIDLRPGANSGIVIRLSVPLSMAADRLLLMRCAGQTFAVPVHAIQRLHRIKLDTIHTSGGRPAILLEGRSVPLYSLPQLLGLQTPAAAPSMVQVVVLRAGGGQAAIAVDEFLGETDSVIQDLGPSSAHNPKVSGGIVLDDGRIAIVLNTAELLADAHRAEAPVFPKTPEAAPETMRSSILVVDDSMTTRTLEKSILEANGYRVRVAVDGMDALSQLRVTKADLVITDVQMPRLDGFGLLKAMKEDRGLRQIPVIVVTSLENVEDRTRGLELGADAYIVKRKFDQEELIAAIRQIL